MVGVRAHMCACACPMRPPESLLKTRRLNIEKVTTAYAANYTNQKRPLLFRHARRRGGAGGRVRSGLAWPPAPGSCAMRYTAYAYAEYSVRYYVFPSHASPS